MITDFRIGHYTDLENITGCTVVLAPRDGAVGGVDVRGPAPGTRETELLGTGHLIERAHAIVLAGGSAFGLDAATGVAQYLEGQNIGYDVGIARVPIVASAVLFDLAIGNAHVRPNAANGFKACLFARNDSIDEGNVGAGTGATIGKLRDMEHATKSGIGYRERSLKNGVTVSALVAVNALGDVIDPSTGQIVGGARKDDGAWADSSALLLNGAPTQDSLLQNTTIGVVMTDATLTVEQANLIARMAHDGIARATRPSHTLFDGDTLFVLASGARGASDVTTLGHAAAECVADAIVRGVKLAQTLGGVKAMSF
ncbi:MAG: P1 family peptidase [Chloroflexi bacterium]|nr:P1 family peptidase [Chloroflexota bacterium]